MINLKASQNGIFFIILLELVWALWEKCLTGQYEKS